MGDVIRVGIVGAGNNTRLRHIPGLKAIEGVEIVSVCNRSRESSERVAKEFGIPKIYNHWRELVEADDTNAIVIGTWPYLHCPATLAALDAGKHVLTEARMAMNAREAHMMLAASRAKPHLVTQIVPAPHTLRVDRTVQELLADGFCGQLLAIELRANGTAFADYDSPLHWRQNFLLSGFNVMAMGIWYEALMRWVGEATKVMAMTKVCVQQRKDPESGRLVAVTVPDHVDIICEMACGAQAHLQFSAVTGFPPPNGIWLFGSEGTLHFDAASGKLLGARRGDRELKEIQIPPEKEGHWRVEEEWVNAIRGKEKVKLTDFETGVKYMEWTEAVTRSAQMARAIALPLTL